MLMGYHYFMRDFVTVHGKEPSIKKLSPAIKNHKSIWSEINSKKPGKATISAVINGKNKASE